MEQDISGQSDSFEFIYAHYENTCSLVRDAKDNRNKGYIMLCVFAALLFLIPNHPTEISQAISSFIYSKIEVAFDIGITAVRCLVWILTLYTLIRYVQNSLYVERQYAYLGKLEDKMSDYIGKNIIDREGKNYSKDYPLVLNAVDKFYKWFSPTLLIIISGYCIFTEWCGQPICFSLICNTIVALAIIAFTVLYIIAVNSNYDEN